MTDLSNVAIGTVLPHRSPSPVEVDTITRVARRAETLGFADLWVTENVVDQAYSFDPIPLLTHAAAVTTSIRVGIAVMVLPVRHPIHVAQSCATLDHLSGGRFTLGVGIGREHHYREFGVPMTRRVARFKESIAIMRALWSEPTVTIKGDFYELDEVTIPLKPVQSPFPVWIGSAHPDAVRRAANIGDGWMGAGSQPRVAFEQSLKLLHQTLQTNGRDPADFPVSKRLFMVIDEDSKRARRRLADWFAAVYGDAALADTAGVFGTQAQVAEQMQAMVDLGVNHLLLNPIDDFDDQLEQLAAILKRT